LAAAFGRGGAIHFYRRRRRDFAVSGGVVVGVVRALKQP